MQQKEEAQKAESDHREPKVIAIVLNGAKYNLLRTSHGLRWCLAKHIGTPAKHFPIATLHDLIENVRLGGDNVEIWVSSDPNTDDPELDLEFDSFRKLERDGFNIYNTGYSAVRVVRQNSAFRA